jgi:hypothetical protein
MSDDGGDHDFTGTDAGASNTYPVRAGEVKKGSFVVIKEHPCKVRQAVTRPAWRRELGAAFPHSDPCASARRRSCACPPGPSAATIALAARCWCTAVLCIEYTAPEQARCARAWPAPASGVCFFLTHVGTNPVTAECGRGSCTCACL